jgi:hypothetical protein
MEKSTQTVPTSRGEAASSKPRGNCSGRNDVRDRSHSAGSNDRTAEIARELGAGVFNIAWIDDFVAAHNKSLARATGDYAFWLAVAFSRPSTGSITSSSIKPLGSVCRLL